MPDAESKFRRTMTLLAVFSLIACAIAAVFCIVEREWLTLGWVFAAAMWIENCRLLSRL